MKKLLLILLIITAMGCSKNECTQEAFSERVVNTQRTTNGFINVCHVTGNGESHTITIPVADYDEHIAHGDTEGDCPTLSDNGLNFADGEVVEIDCKYELPFIHIDKNGKTWIFSEVK